MKDVRVRRAEKKDIKQVDKLVKEFFENDIPVLQYSCEDSLSLIKDVIENKIGFVLEKDSRVIGMLGGYVIGLYASKSRCFHEICWFVSEKHRRYGVFLFNEVEKFCRLNGIDKMIFILLTNSVQDKVRKFYEKKGFVPLEEHYIKNLV